MSRSSHKAQIRAILESGGTITEAESASLFSCRTLAQRIYDLRKDGMKILSVKERHNNGIHARYSLAMPESEVINV